MRKVKMMIVDDEPLVRTLIKSSVNWDDTGVEIVAEAGSADEALPLAEKLRPEIMLLDICMPGMNGIELAERVSRLLPDIKMIVISGHDTFSFAQQCIRLGVTDYLLKPLNEERLETVVRSIVKGIRPESLLGAKSRAPVRECIDYLYANFRDSALSLQGIANQLHVNPSYLSAAFSEDTGESFVETLTGLRMEEAIRLIKTTSLRGYEIAEKVGMTDPKYFGACFKKYTGLTLHEYRKENRAR